MLENVLRMPLDAFSDTNFSSISVFIFSSTSVKLTELYTFLCC